MHAVRATGAFVRTRAKPVVRDLVSDGDAGLCATSGRQDRKYDGGDWAQLVSRLYGLDIASELSLKFSWWL